jgi:hypothetical protein
MAGGFHAAHFHSSDTAQGNMSTPAEKSFKNAKLSYEELLTGLRRWPEDNELRARLRAANLKLRIAREMLHVERYGRR